MKLIFVMYPVGNVEDAAAYYRHLGFTDVWWPDEDTVLLSGTSPGSVDIMLEQHPAETQAGAGAVFNVDSVDAFYSSHTELAWVLAPCDIPVGRYAIFRDSQDNPVRLLDLAYDDDTFARLLREDPAGQRHAARRWLTD